MPCRILHSCLERKVRVCPSCIPRSRIQVKAAPILLQYIVEHIGILSDEELLVYRFHQSDADRCDQFLAFDDTIRQFRRNLYFTAVSAATFSWIRFFA